MSRSTPRRIDANQAEIVEALTKAGCVVFDLSSVGGGCPDLCVGRNGETFLLEVKVPKGKLNKRQQEWHIKWRGQVAIVRSIDEALRAVGVI